MAKLSEGNEVSTIQNINKLYRTHNPGYVFKPQFIDQDYEALYASEESIAVLSKYFAGLAIVISWPGLIRFSGIYYRATGKRNRNKEDTRIRTLEDCLHAVNGLYQDGAYFHGDCLTNKLLVWFKVARGFRI